MTPLRRFAAWLARLPTPFAVLAGLILVGVPTAFTVFSRELSDVALSVRFVIIGLWSLTAIAVVLATVSRDRAWDQLIDGRLSLRRNLRSLATAEVLTALLRSEIKGLPPTYEFTVYIYDEKKELLTPIFPKRQGEADVRNFKAGNGATGTAWSRNSTVVVTGDAVANSEYGLTRKQQTFFQGYRTVASTPIRNEAEEMFGVLTVMGHEDDGFFAEAAAGPPVLRELADVLGVVLETIPDPQALI